MYNIYDVATKIKIKNILTVKFKGGKKYKTYNEPILDEDSWNLITDYNDIKYIYKSKKTWSTVYPEHPIIKVGSEYYINFHEYESRGYKNKHIYFIIPEDLSLAEDILGDLSQVSYEDVVLIYENKSYLDNPYEVHFRFGELIANNKKDFKYTEKDLAHAMASLLNKHLEDRKKNEGISVYKGESKDKIIEICKEKYKNRLQEEVDWDAIFTLFYKKHGSGGHDKCYLDYYNR